MADGLTYGNRVNHFSTSRAAAAVVDAYLNSATLASRLMYSAKPFAVSGRGEMPTLIQDVKISGRSQGQWFVGLEQLNSAAEDVTIQMEFNHNAYSMPVVDVMLEAFAREGAGEDVDFAAFNYEDALDQVVQDMSDAIYGIGTGDQILGLEGIVDDGTNKATIGGQSRTTYSGLKSTVTASAGVLSLSKMATMVSGVEDTGAKERLSVIATTTDILDLYESLLTPTVSHEYMVLPVSGKNPVTSGKADSLAMGQGFRAFTYRGIPVISDKQCTAQTMYFLNENYLNFYGRSNVPSKYKSFLSPVKLGKSVKEGQASNKPSNFHGFFYQEEQMMPNQAGIISRFYVIGQLASFQPRRHGKLTGITSVA